MAKPSIPKGTRDFLPVEMNRRNFIFDTIRSVFKKYGYLPIETPSMEKTETLLGKYGEEGDRLIFKVLQRGDKLKKELVKNANGEPSNLAGEALRYDLTVPFARFVVQNWNSINFPFKRYQIQPVWRADRPQKGRYREFYQCDADVIGSDSLIYEVELIQIFDEVLSLLGIEEFTIRVNHRKILIGIAAASKITEIDKYIDIIMALDKLDKVGLDGVRIELLSKGISEQHIDNIFKVINIEGDWRMKFQSLSKEIELSAMGKEGLIELKKVFEAIDNIKLRKGKLIFDHTLARGLNYYTGAIFEVIADKVKIGSICGGGRYDGLLEIFDTKRSESGIGISFGADRIYDVMDELKIWPDNLASSVKLIFINFGEKESNYVLPLLKKVREANISSEIYPSSAKIQKQMKYANAKGAEYVAMVGENEMNSGKIVLKNMDSGEQQEVSIDELISQLS